MLMVESDLDPHMIIKFKDEIKVCFFGYEILVV